MAQTFSFSPRDLLDWARRRLDLRSDSALAQRLGMWPPTLSKIRHGGMPLGPAFLVRLLEATDVHLRDLPRLLEETNRQGRKRRRR